MGTNYTVRLSEALFTAVQSWPEEARLLLAALKMALEEDGLDAVCGLDSETVDNIEGVTIEYREQGEIVAMVWVRILLDTDAEPSTIFVRFGDPGIPLTDR
jgi:hypothetical protein